MRIVQTNAFSRAVKRLHKNEKKALDKAVKFIVSDPTCGDLKIGDLSGLRVYKFKVVAQQYLLGYLVDEDVLVLTLVGLGSHENFYRDLKQQ